jgi:regulatory protein
MARRGVPADVAAAVLDRFTEVGLVDDAAFAASWVESRQSGRGLSRRALAEELRRKGIAGEVVAESLQSIDDEREVEAARRLVDKKLRSSRVSDPQARWRQLVGLLARRGYPPGVAMRVVAEALSEAAEPSPPDAADGPALGG